jgi:hypothetical protein
MPAPASAVPASAVDAVFLLDCAAAGCVEEPHPTAVAAVAAKAAGIDVIATSTRDRIFVISIRPF